MGVASGMPCDADLLALLPRYMVPGAPGAPGPVWQTTLIGRAEIWPVHQKTAELGGMLRTGLEDTFYLPDGSRANGNGVLIEALARCARNAGRAIASPAEAALAGRPRRQWHEHPPAAPRAAEDQARSSVARRVLRAPHPVPRGASASCCR
jgi:hypothetical protein